MSKRIPSFLALGMASAILLSACVTQEPHFEPRANYTVFTDSTWLPESKIRAPYGAKEIAIDPVQVLQSGIYSFYDTDECAFMAGRIDSREFIVQELLSPLKRHSLSLDSGTNMLYRNSVPISDWGQARALVLDDGRIFVKTMGKANISYTVRLTAYDISGKPIRQFLRDGNNQPEEIAYFINDEHTFPAGSVAYIPTYWLGADEILRPTQKDFTGAATLDRFLKNFSNNSFFCISYLDHQDASPYALRFEQPGLIKRFLQIKSGQYTLVPADRDALFCKRGDGDEKIQGTWRLRSIQGTPVMELEPPKSVKVENFGIQPINEQSVQFGFAQIEMASDNGSISKYKAKATASQPTMVVPVRILKRNMPIVDFHLKFNATAAAAIRLAVSQAEPSRQAHESKHAQ